MDFHFIHKLSFPMVTDLPLLGKVLLRQKKFLGPSNILCHISQQVKEQLILLNSYQEFLPENNGQLPSQLTRAAVRKAVVLQNLAP